MRGRVKTMKDKGILEVTAFYGSNILYNLKLSKVDVDNLQLKLNEIFMAGQKGIDKTWKEVMDELKKDIEREELYVKVKHGGIWLMRTSLSPSNHSLYTSYFVNLLFIQISPSIF